MLIVIRPKMLISTESDPERTHVLFSTPIVSECVPREESAGIGI